MNIRILSYLLAVSLAGPCLVQAQTQTDTLDWRGYYPLEVGNAWEWQTELIASYHAVERREIIADTVFEAKRYFVQAQYASVSDNGQRYGGADTLLLRYDSLNTRIVARSINLGEEFDYTCDLSAEHDAVIECLYTEMYVYFRYAGPEAYLRVGSDTLRYNAERGYATTGGGRRYYHGIGIMLDVGEGNLGTVELSYVRLSGQEYGRRTYYVGVEDEAVPEQVVLSLYPNPVRDKLHLASEGELSQARIFDVLGREQVSASECRGGRCSVDVSVLPAGVYIVMSVLRSGDKIMGQIVVAR